MLRKIPFAVAIATALALFAGCGSTPEPKIYKVDGIRVIGTTAYVEMRVTDTKIKIVDTCDVTQEKVCAILEKGDTFSAVVIDGKLTKVKIKKP